MTDKPERKPNRLHLSHARQDAEHLKKQFENGNMLAPFEYCAIWQKEGLPSSTLPEWVTDHFQSFAASYFEAGEQVVERRLIDMKSSQRKSVLPSLDKTAGLLGDRGKLGAWHWRAERGRDPYVQAYLDDLKVKRESGEKPVLQDPLTNKEIVVFDKQGPHKGKFSDKALDLIARQYRIKGHAGKNRARTMRRRFKLD